jgi:hypothetical protein
MGTGNWAVGVKPFVASLRCQTAGAWHSYGLLAVLAPCNKLLAACNDHRFLFAASLHCSRGAIGWR